jgi:hypothetical protein
MALILTATPKKTMPAKRAGWGINPNPAKRFPREGANELSLLPLGDCVAIRESALMSC